MKAHIRRIGMLLTVFLLVGGVPFVGAIQVMQKIQALGGSTLCSMTLGTNRHTTWLSATGWMQWLPGSYPAKILNCL